MEVSIDDRQLYPLIARRVEPGMVLANFGSWPALVTSVEANDYGQLIIEFVFTLDRAHARHTRKARRSKLIVSPETPLKRYHEN